MTTTERLFNTVYQLLQRVGLNSYIITDEKTKKFKICVNSIDFNQIQLITEFCKNKDLTFAVVPEDNELVELRFTSNIFNTNVFENIKL